VLQLAAPNRDGATMMMPITALEVICAGCGDIFHPLYDESELTVTDEDRELAITWGDTEESVAEGRVLFDESFAAGWRQVLEEDGSLRGWFCGPCFNALAGC
jgi:hypothetical protein